MFEDSIIVPVNWVKSDEIIKVVGVGGGGCNAVTYMFNEGIKGCSFVVCNTDAQALGCSSVPLKIQLGEGLGAGTNPTKARNAAIEGQETIDKVIFDKHTKMLFLTAGMGGGTGTGATPVIAKMAKDKGILTVAVVTLPFKNEGSESMTRAIDGIHELENNVDSLIIINNEKLYEYFGDLLVQDAFPKADEVLATAVRGIIEIIKKPGFINVDFQDVITMMKNSGMALMGSGTGSGENRIDDALKEAFESPLLNDFDLKTARNVLINITAGKNDQGLKMHGLGDISEKIAKYTGNARNFKHGLVWDENPEIGDSIHITVIATGFRFNPLICPDLNVGNIILIDKDYKYEPGDNISITSDEELTSKNDSPSKGKSFHFNQDEVPDLLLRGNLSKEDLREIPAIRRK